MHLHSSWFSHPPGYFITQALTNQLKQLSKVSISGSLKIYNFTEATYHGKLHPLAQINPPQSGDCRSQHIQLYREQG